MSKTLEKLALRRSVYVKNVQVPLVQELVLIASQSHELRLVGFMTVLLCQKKRLIASNLSIRSLTIYWRQRPITTLADSARLIGTRNFASSAVDRRPFFIVSRPTAYGTGAERHWPVPGHRRRNKPRHRLVRTEECRLCAFQP